MKKIMVVAMTALLIGSSSVGAMAAGHQFVGGHGGFHGGFHGGHVGGFHHGFGGRNYAGRYHGGRWGGGYDDDDDFVGPLIAGGVIGGGAWQRFEPLKL